MEECEELTVSLGLGALTEAQSRPLPNEFVSPELTLFLSLRAIAAGQSGTESTLPALGNSGLRHGELSFSCGGSQAEQQRQVMQDRSPCTNLSCLRAPQAAVQNKGLCQAGFELERTWTRQRKNETEGRERMILWGKLCKYVLPFPAKVTEGVRH